MGCHFRYGWTQSHVGCVQMKGLNAMILGTSKSWVSHAKGICCQVQHERTTTMGWQSRQPPGGTQQTKKGFEANTKKITKAVVHLCVFCYSDWKGIDGMLDKKGFFFDTGSHIWFCVSIEHSFKRYMRSTLFGERISDWRNELSVSSMNISRSGLVAFATYCRMYLGEKKGFWIECLVVSRVSYQRRWTNLHPWPCHWRQ